MIYEIGWDIGKFDTVCSGESFNFTWSHKKPVETCALCIGSEAYSVESDRVTTNLVRLGSDVVLTEQSLNVSLRIGVKASQDSKAFSITILVEKVTHPSDELVTVGNKGSVIDDSPGDLFADFVVETKA